jgi:hypothetical protein
MKFAHLQSKICHHTHSSCLWDSVIVAVPTFLRNILHLFSSFFYIGLQAAGSSKTFALIYRTTTHSTTQHHFRKILNSQNYLLPECLTKDVHLRYSNVLNKKDDKHMWQAKKPSDLAELLHLTQNKIPVCNTVYKCVTQGNHDVHLLSIIIYYWQEIYAYRLCGLLPTKLSF